MNGTVRLELLERCLQYLMGVKQSQEMERRRRAADKRLLRAITTRGTDPTEALEMWKTDYRSITPMSDEDAIEAVKKFFGM